MQTDELHLKNIDESLLRNPVDTLREVQNIHRKTDLEQQRILEAKQKEIEGNLKVCIQINRDQDIDQAPRIAKGSRCPCD